jgi:phosphonate transport system substrate-binding protein
VAVGFLATFVCDALARDADGMPHLLILAAVSDNPRKLQGAMQPMADYMAGRLAPLGVEGIEVVVVDSRAQMVRLLRDGRVDWVSETAYSAILLEQKAGAQVLLRKWKQGVPEYQSLIFTHKDSPLQSLQDLADHNIAFQHPGSTTGYFQPASQLRAAGHDLRRLRTIWDRPEPGSLGFLFSGAEYNTAMWVHKRLVHAGVLSNLDWHNEAFVPAGIRGDLKIIYTSDPIPRALEMVRGDLHPGIKAAMKEVLLSAHLDPEAGPALQAYQETKRFDELDSATLIGMQKIRDMLSSDFAADEVSP